MARLIDVFPLRPRLPLDGIWDFCPESRPLQAPPSAQAFKEKLPVPGVWESAFRHFDYRGFGWYRRTFEWTFPGPARLMFGAVTHTAEVFLDGRRLGSHHGAHTEFDFVIPSLKAGRHTLCVRVGNTYGPDNPLYYPQQDIYLYGGIPQSVTLEALPATGIRNAAAVPRKVVSEWTIEVSASLRTPDGKPASGSLAITLDGKPAGTLAVGRAGNGRAVIKAGRVKEWSPETPALSVIRLESATDAWQERLGFRTVAVRGRDILLNGKPLVLKGVNRHEHHPDFGCALPATVHARDIEILKTLGANFVRGSHYPNDPLFLDLCDENGLLFWEELAHWQPKEAHFKDPLFLRRSLEQLDETVARDRHHPSIIMWGMLNEGQTSVPAARKVVGSLARRFRKLDPTRPVTFATCCPLGDRCLDLVDIVSCNTYPGWYTVPFKEAGPWMEDLIRKLSARSFNKPMILSEFGGGGITGVRSFENRKWTENYQAALIRELMDAIGRTKRSCGVAVWQYCDVRTSAGMGLSRIREYNNKGVLSDTREPKMAFYALQEAFGKM